jgi:hypothetical protein
MWVASMASASGTAPVPARPPNTPPLDALARRAAVAIVDGSARPIRRVEPPAELPAHLVHPFRHGIWPEEVMACGAHRDGRPAPRVPRSKGQERSNGRLYGRPSPDPAHQLDLAALLVAYGVRHQLEARVARFPSRLVGHGDRALVVDRHQPH